MPFVLLPLLLVAGNLVYWHVDQPMPSRSAEWVLALAAVLGVAALWRRRPQPGPALPADPPATLLVRLRRLPPWAWVCAALAWQILALAWSPHPDLGCIVLAERTAALLAAVGFSAWYGGRSQLKAWPLPLVGGALLVLAAISGIPVGGTAENPLRLGNLLLATTAAPPPTFEQPFGLNNFNVPAALPLLAVAAGVLAAGRWREAGHRSGVMAVILLVGLAALVCIGLGFGTDHRLTAAWYGLLFLVCAAVAVARFLPRRLAPWAYGAVLLVPLAVQLVIIGIEDLPAKVPASIVDRMGIWLGSRDAIFASPLFGHGTGGGAVAISAESIRNVGWLAVPGFPEHAHHELLHLWLEGGLIAVLLLLPAVWGTLRGLWRQRHRPLANGLLVAWAVVLGHLLIESHLSQPGPLLCLALLAGISWAAMASGPPAEPPPAPGYTLGLPAALLAALAVGGIGWTTWRVAHDRGPAGIDAEYTGRRCRDKPLEIVAREVLDLRERIGLVSDFDVPLVIWLASTGHEAEAREMAITLGERLPACPDNLPLLIKLDMGRRDERIQQIMDRAEEIVNHRLLDQIRWGNVKKQQEFQKRLDDIYRALNLWDSLPPKQ